MINKAGWFGILLIFGSRIGIAQTGCIHEPVQLVGSESVDPQVHEGRLQYAWRVILRNLPNRKTPNEDPHPPLAAADEPVATAVFFVDDVLIKSIKQ